MSIEREQHLNLLASAEQPAEKPSRKQNFVPGPEKPSRSRRSWDRPLVQLRRCSLVILYSAHGLCSLLTPRTIYMHSVSPTTMLFSSGRNQLVVWWRTTSFARQGSRNAYVASAILALLSELTTSMTEYHQNDNRHAERRRAGRVWRTTT